MNTIISFIVPVHNGEENIENCLNSILNLNRENIEILVINDGSTDDTERILNCLLQNEKRIKVVSTKNQGVSCARNVGINIASGKYITFVDSDDSINTQIFDELIDMLLVNTYEIVVADYYCIDGKQKNEVTRKYLSDKDCDVIRLNKELLTGRANSVWSCIYNGDLIRNNQVRFREDIVIGEDAIFNIEYTRLCTEYKYFDRPIYNYNKNNKFSISHQYSFEYIDDYITMFEAYRSLINRNSRLNLEIDRDFYLSRVFKCLLNKPRIISKQQKKKIKSSWLYMQVVLYDYQEIRNIIKKSIVRIIMA